ncbi:MAG: WhiB family transcriptional regulator [Actinomycetota bacterium]
MTQNLPSLPDDLSVEVLESLNRLSQWRERANCKGKRKLFFGHHSERPQARIRRETKAGLLCKCCEVKPDCREFARLNREYGFWGGENEEQRHLAGFKVIAPIGVRAKVLRPTTDFQTPSVEPET